jgi:solute carrier family 25 protein 39/40
MANESSSGGLKKLLSTSSFTKRNALFERIASASVGALITSLVVTPLEVVKVRLQSQASLKSALDVAHARTPLECPACKEIIFDNGLMEHRFPRQALECRNHVTFTGTFDALRWIIKCEGVGSLFNGLSATLWMAIPATVLYFATYEELRDRLNAANPQTQAVNPLLAGAFARVFAATTVAPLELIRTNAQAESRPPSLLKMASSIARREGVGAFWRGLSPTLWRDVPFSAFYWILVEQIRATEVMRRQNSTFVVAAASGAASGVVAAILTHPFDVIKTRRQVFDLANTNPPTKSTLGMMSKIVAQDGFHGLWVGLFPRVAKIAPSTAIMLSTYEVGKRFFHDRLEAEM